ncbi:Thiolase-like protein [Pseudocohnilembus persalinus]|uniref:Thiolase-like protein n=1 Tax=Pseudocohnilembus persalinus TaxID=266149 RepID=A0A0V0Q870_PSEPJ|nr:Thiolase-like protein [Pseudocohnilembus persalinus]|eukprot:KRW98363.1 Thiolase-like protein [Pseudocohnilembus persalinus]
MDILEIGASRGQKVDFMTLVKEPYKKKCARYVEKCGGPYQIFVPEKDKTPMDYFEEAFRPLKKYKDKIDVIIDGSTTRGFMQPSQASLYAQQAGLKPTQYFDMSQACNGFCLALEQAYMMFECNKELEDKYILIINNEQPPEGRALEPNDVNDYKQVSSYFVGLTFSSVCTCTILKRSSNYSWEFIKYSNPKYASHISIGLPQIAEGYLPKCEKYDVYLNDQYGQFCIPRLHQVHEKINFILKTYFARKDFFKKCHLITHTFTNTVYDKCLYYEKMEKLSLYYSNAGNLASCSLPYILWMEYGEKIKDGQNILFFGNAAGGADCNLLFTHNKKYDIKQGQGILKQRKQLQGNKYINAFKYGVMVAIKKIICPSRRYPVTTEPLEIELNDQDNQNIEKKDTKKCKKQKQQ